MSQLKPQSCRIHQWQKNCRKYSREIEKEGILMLGRNTAGNGKHALQHASLLGHMDRLGFLDPKYTFLEFGAGKGIVY